MAAKIKGCPYLALRNSLIFFKSVISLNCALENEADLCVNFDSV